MSMVVALAAAAAPAAAQPAPSLAKPHVQAMTKKARELYAEGVAAYGQKRWADARAAFVGAWALNQHFTIAGNLGAAELKLGLYREAAEHLSLYAREVAKDAEATDKERQEAAALLTEARTKVGTLVILTKSPGAEVFVDGVRVGAAPLNDPVFVDPGEHTVEVRAEGFRTARETKRLEAGMQADVDPALVRIEAAAPGAGAGAGVGLGGAGAGSAGRVATSPVEDPSTPRPRLWPIAVGGAVAAVALGVGVGLTVAANGKSAEVERLSVIGDEDWLCNANAPRGPHAECPKLKSAVEARDRLSNAAMGVFIGAGVVALGTAGYAIWELRRHRTPRDTGVQVLPLAGPQGGGIAVRGAW